MLQDFGTMTYGPKVLLSPRRYSPDLNRRHRVSAAELPIKGKTASRLAINNFAASPVLVDDHAPIIERALMSAFS